MQLGNIGNIGNIGNLLGNGGIQGENPIQRLLEMMMHGGASGCSCGGGCCGGSCHGGGCSHCAHSASQRGAGILG